MEFSAKEKQEELPMERLARAHVFTCARFKFNLADLFQRLEGAFVNMRDSLNRFSRPFTNACDRRTDHLSIDTHARTYNASRDCLITEGLDAFSDSLLVAIDPLAPRSCAALSQRHSTESRECVPASC